MPSALLHRLVANDVAVPARPHRLHRHAERARRLRERPHDHAAWTPTSTWSSPARAQAVRDRDVHRAANCAKTSLRCTVTDVTAMYSMIAVMGPRSRELLQRVSTDDFSNEAFPFGTSREIDVGYATVRATRLHLRGRARAGSSTCRSSSPSASTRRCSRPVATWAWRDAGYYAIDSLRLEKGYRAWGRELSPDITPYEAGLGFAVKLDKPGGFMGRAKLAALKGQAPSRRVVSLVVDAPHTNLWGGEAHPARRRAGRLRHLGRLRPHDRPPGRAGHRQRGRRAADEGVARSRPLGDRPRRRAGIRRPCR